MPRLCKLPAHLCWGSLSTLLLLSRSEFIFRILVSRETGSTIHQEQGEKHSLDLRNSWSVLHSGSESSPEIQLRPGDMNTSSPSWCETPLKTFRSEISAGWQKMQQLARADCAALTYSWCFHHMWPRLDTQDTAIGSTWMSSSGSFITQVDSVTITAVSAQHLPATQNRPAEQAFLPRSLYSHGAPASPSLVSSITTLLSIAVFLVWRELNKWTRTFQTHFSLSTLLSTCPHRCV